MKIDPKEVGAMKTKMYVPHIGEEVLVGYSPAEVMGLEIDFVGGRAEVRYLDSFSGDSLEWVPLADIKKAPKKKKRR